MPVNSVPAMGWTRRSAAISVLLVCEEQRKRAGVRVVQLREAKNWSQETLAQKAGLSTKTVSRFENGVHEGRTGTVQKLAKALGVNQYEVTGPPPAPLGLADPAPEPVESALAEVLAAITAQLAAQTEVLNEVKDVLLDVKALLGKDTETADEMRTLTGTLGGAAEQLDAHLRELEARVPQSEPQRKTAAKRKTAPKSSPRP